jgi:hypothetical protein
MPFFSVSNAISGSLNLIVLYSKSILKIIFTFN